MQHKAASLCHQTSKPMWHFLVPFSTSLELAFVHTVHHSILNRAVAGQPLAHTLSSVHAHPPTTLASPFLLFLHVSFSYSSSCFSTLEQVELGLKDVSHMRSLAHRTNTPLPLAGACVCPWFCCSYALCRHFCSQASYAFLCLHHSIDHKACHTLDRRVVYAPALQVPFMCWFSKETDVAQLCHGARPHADMAFSHLLHARAVGHGSSDWGAIALAIRQAAGLPIPPPPQRESL